MADEAGSVAGEAPRACAFCKKSVDEVRVLVAGPGVSICGECVHVCVDIVADERRRQEGVLVAGGDSARLPAWYSQLHCNLCHMPVAVEDTVPVEHRGLLCRECIAAVHAAVAKRRVERVRQSG